MKTIKIAINDINGIKLEVKALYSNKRFAINRTIDQLSYSYTISHIDSGLAVIHLSNKNEAIKLCNKLNKMFPDICNAKSKANEMILGHLYEKGIYNFYFKNYN